MKYGYSMLTQPSTFLSISLIKKNGLLRENLHYTMDYELYLRCGNLRRSAIYIDQQLSIYRLHDRSKTTTSEDAFISEWKNLRKEYCGFSQTLLGRISEFVSEKLALSGALLLYIFTNRDYPR